MRVTLKEIAREAGVHISTVDKVLHHRPGVSNAVRERVQRIIDEKGYTPNQAGSALQKAGKEYRFDAVLLKVDAEQYLRDGIQEWIRGHQEYNIDIHFHRSAFQDVTAQVNAVKTALSGNTNGIILFPNYADEVREAVRSAVKKEIPVVTVNSDIDRCGRICHVGQNGSQTACMAGRMMGLLLGGCGDAAIITSSVDSENSDYHVGIRENAFMDFLKQHYPGIRIVERIENFENETLTYEKTKELILRHPGLDGLYITCGGVRMVGKALKDIGAAGRIKVISYESYPEIVELLNEDVISCTIGSNLKLQGSTAVRVLTEYLVYGRVPKDEIFIESQIMVKECFLPGTTFE